MASPTYASMAARHQAAPSMPSAAPAPPLASTTPRPAPRLEPTVKSIVVVPDKPRHDGQQVTPEWQEVLGKRGKRPTSLPSSGAAVNAGQRPLTRSSAAEAFKQELRGRCYRCFDPEHTVRHCTNFARCIHCLDEGHPARNCPTRHLPRVPLPPLHAARRRPANPPVRSRLVFPPDHPDHIRQPVHSRIAFPTAIEPPVATPAQSSPTAPPPPPPLADPFPTMAAELGFVRRSLCTKVVLDHSQEMVDEEILLRSSALVFTVSGTQPRLAPGQLREGLLTDFPELPTDAVQISLRQPGVFFARFSTTRWCDLVAALPLFHYRGTPITISRWSRLTFATFSKYRFSVRLFLEQLAPQAWSLATVQRALPGCLIHTVTGETLGKHDLSYYVLEAWVDRLEDVPTETVIDIHEPKPCVDPLSHSYLPAGFSSPDAPVPGAGTPWECCNQDHLRECPPRMLGTRVLVHLDSSIYIRPAPATRNQWTSRDDDSFDDGDDEDTLEEEQVHPWAHGVPDDVWHQRLEATSAGSASGQHRPRRRAGGCRRRVAAPEGFHAVPLHAPLGCETSTVEPHVHAVTPSNGEAGDAASALLHAVCVATPSVAVSTRPPGPPLAPPTVNTTMAVPAAPVLPPTPNWPLPLFVPSAPCSADPLRPSLLGSVLQTTQCTPPPDAAQPEQLVSPAPRTTPQAAPTAAETQSAECDDALPATEALQDAAVLYDPRGGPNLGEVPTDEPDLRPIVTGHVVLAHQASPSLAITNGPATLTPLRQTADQLLSSITQPITPGLIPFARSPHTPPGPPRRPRTKCATTATRRSHRIKNRKQEVTGGGNTTMKLARKLIVSKRGLALAEKGDESDDETLRLYEGAFDNNLSPVQLQNLAALAKEASRKRKTAARRGNKPAPAPGPSQMVSPVQ